MKDCKSLSEQELESVSGGYKFNETVDDIPNLTDPQTGRESDMRFGEKIDDFLEDIKDIFDPILGNNKDIL